MASVYKKKYPTPLPVGAEIITRRGKKLARWENGKGQIRTAELLADGRMQFVSDCWYVRYRDADGRMRRGSTGCREKQAAEKVLADILADVEKVKAGIISSEKIDTARQLDTPIGKHIEKYLVKLAVKTIRGKRVSTRHVYNVRQQLGRVVCECGFKTLKDINRQSAQGWLMKLAETPRDPNELNSKTLSARTINIHRAAIMAFCNWCVQENKLTANPLTGLSKMEEFEPARKRRALTENEIARLLKAAHNRSLREARTIRYDKNKGKLIAKVRVDIQHRLERLGQERALVYKLMILTGLRRGEVASLTVGSLHLDETHPYVQVEGRHIKSGRAATLPLRDDLADDLRKHVAHLREAHCGTASLIHARSKSHVVCLSEVRDHPASQIHDRSKLHIPRLNKDNGDSITPDTPLFHIGRNFLRTFNLDLAAAGIAKRDEQGRTVDMHCLRHTFATLLARNGVSPSIAQKLMRHSDIRLTMNTYLVKGFM